MTTGRAAYWIDGTLVAEARIGEERWVEESETASGRERVWVCPEEGIDRLRPPPPGRFGMDDGDVAVRLLVEERGHPARMRRGEHSSLGGFLFFRVLLVRCCCTNAQCWVLPHHFDSYCVCGGEHPTPTSPFALSLLGAIYRVDSIPR